MPVPVPDQRVDNEHIPEPCPESGRVDRGLRVYSKQNIVKLCSVAVMHRVDDRIL